MSPKDKAKELVEKFMFVTLDKKSWESKQCALICVDEILKAEPSIEQQDHGITWWKGNEDYWEEVKQEINKL